MHCFELVRAVVDVDFEHLVGFGFYFIFPLLKQGRRHDNEGAPMSRVHVRQIRNHSCDHLNGLSKAHVISVNRVRDSF